MPNAFLSSRFVDFLRNSKVHILGHMAFMIIDRNFWQRSSNISLIEAVVTGRGHAMYGSFF